ncbi:MAG: 4-amino-4-deoxy-L-arabinose transferase [Planctomycetes bacterium]|nr:4-amino-4-deoxy-L-arabinose transferase [Planctomycetota bacterium]
MILSAIRSQRRIWGPAVVALLAWGAASATLDPTGEFPDAPEGPGLTVDETFNIQQGAYLVQAVRIYGLGLLHPASVREVFGSPPFLPDHPPLGRLWIGLWHEGLRTLFGPDRFPSRFSPTCARTASAAAFALLVFLVGVFAGRWYGPLAGTVAALALVLMPRLFGHAHLAALETFVGLTYTAATLAVAHWWTPRPPQAPEAQPQAHADKDTSSPAPLGDPPSWRVASMAGLILGIALLSKIQAILLIPPICVWTLWHWRRRAIVPLAVWGAVGFVVFFIGWPWLWLDPVHHLTEYLGRTTQRATLSVWYMGQKFADREVPWHYPWVLFLVTVPIGLQALGTLGVVARTAAWRHPREQLLLTCMAFPLLLFSMPRIAVYDGARLFLVSFPLWAVFIGKGCEQARQWLRQRVNARSAGIVLTVVLACQGWGLLRMHPCYLSYYNAAVGGLGGASRLGFELTYWGDSITRGFLREVVRHVPPGTTIAVAPTLHEFQWGDLRDESPLLKGRDIRFAPYGTSQADRAVYLLVFFRKADLPRELRHPPAGGERLAEVRRCGVLLATLYASPKTP